MVARLKVTVPAAALVYDKKVLKQTLRVAGNEVAAATRKMLRNSVGAGRVYYGIGGSAKYRGGYQKGRYTASAPGASPAKVTGTLASSIKVKPYKSGEGVSIRDTQFYALFLEAGAQGGGGKGVKNVYSRRGGKRFRVSIKGKRVLQPRPFLSRALAERQASLGDRIGDAAAAGVKLQRMKP